MDATVFGFHIQPSSFSSVWLGELGGRLLSKQRENGSRVNDSGRWMESNPVLVTAFTILSLEQIYDSIPAK